MKEGGSEGQRHDAPSPVEEERVARSKAILKQMDDAAAATTEELGACAGRRDRSILRDAWRGAGVAIAAVDNQAKERRDER